MATRSNVIRLTPERRMKHQIQRLVYLGPLSRARCKCGRTRSKWGFRKALEHGGFQVTKYECPCGRRIVKIDEVRRGGADK